MRLEYRKAAMAALWALAIPATGFAANVTSMWGWTLLGCVALIPPAVALWLWREPPQTMSQSIRDAMR